MIPFTLPNQDNIPVSSSDWRGHRVILFVFVRAESDVCTAQITGFKDVFTQIEATGARVYGIGVDPPETLQRWHTAHDLPFDLLYDANHQVLESLGAWDNLSFKARDFAAPIRVYAVLDADGVIIAQGVRVTVQMCIDRALAALE